MILTSSWPLPQKLQCVRFRGIESIVRLDAKRPRQSGPRSFPALTSFLKV